MTELVIPDPSCVLLVGAAGAGKSTFAARHFPAGSILSSDALRAAIGADESDQGVSRAAFAALHRSLDRRLAAGRLTVVDATNLTLGARRSIRAIARRHAIPIVAIVLDLPPREVRARNAAREGRLVPDAVVDRHLARLRAIVDTDELAAEGYARIELVHSALELDALRIRLVPGPLAGDAVQETRAGAARRHHRKDESRA
jgi:protein phosphatase